MSLDILVLPPVLVLMHALLLFLFILSRAHVSYPLPPSTSPPSALSAAMSQWIQTVRGDVLQGASIVSTMFTLQGGFNAFCSARHIDSGHLAPNEFLALLRETAGDMWLSETMELEPWNPTYP